MREPVSTTPACDFHTDIIGSLSPETEEEAEKEEKK